MIGWYVSTRLLACVKVCAIFLVCLLLQGCTWFHSQAQSPLEMSERPSLAILPGGLEVEITKLSSLKTVDGSLAPEEESRQVDQAVREIRDEARWLFQSRLATRYGFQFVPLDRVDAVVAELGLQPGSLPTPEQSAALRTRLGADLLVVINVLDYGKVRWQWAAAGMLTDTTLETLIVGLATGWNPAIILGGVVGWDLLTSTPLWFGGTYLFGVAFRPVRVEARAIETVEGYPIWQDMEVAIYAWKELKQLPEAERRKKENQLRVNLENAMEALADSLTEARLTVTQIRKRKGSH